MNKFGYTPVSKAGLIGTSVGVGETWVTVAGTGVDGDPQAERMKERRSKIARERRSVDKA